MDELQGIIRALLAAGSGALVQHGLVSQADAQTLAGAAMIIGTAIWSYIHKKQMKAAAPK